jgi:acyl-CoA synthetase (AMP-forming)/AMP-acid ligase II
MPTAEEIEQTLTARGAPFEIAPEPVLGQVIPVFVNREPNLRAILEASVAHGDAEYIVCGDQRISFAEHGRIVASVASALRERFGVEKGDRVAILAANCPEWIVSFWAAVSLGAIPVGMNGWWAADEILYALGDSEPKILIGDSKRLARIAGADVACPIVEIESDFEKLWHHDLEAPLPDVPIDEDDPATILYTSGTTGRPKGAVNTHRNIIALCRVQVFHGLRNAMLNAGKTPDPLAPKNCMMINTPLFHVSGLYAGAVTLLATGVRTVWTTGRFDPETVLRLIEEERVTNWGPMGTMLHRVLNHPDFGKYDLSSLRNIGSGGAPMSVEMQARVREAFPKIGSQMGLGYGLTESTALATLNFGEELIAHPESVGRPLPTIDVEIRDADGTPLPEGCEGDVYLRGPLVMKEYWRRPDETAETVVAGRWLRTGDIGWLEEGRLTINSRKRDLILRASENVYPAEIEMCLEAHPDVREAAVVGVPHEELGQEVKAIVVPEEGRMPDPADLAAWVGGRLAYYKVPAHWELRDALLPRNAAGMIMKHVLTGDADNPFVEE